MFYPNTKFNITTDVVDSWYEVLKDLDYQATNLAIIKIVCNNNFFPTIAEIRQATDKRIIKSPRSNFEQREYTRGQIRELEKNLTAWQNSSSKIIKSIGGAKT